MGKFTIDFTTAEKRKFWKAGLSIKLLDKYSLKQILDAVKPGESREEEIRDQFYGFVSTGNSATGLAGLIFKNGLTGSLTSANTGFTSALAIAAKVASKHDAFTGGSVGNMMRLTNKSSSLLGASVPAIFNLSPGISPSLATSGLPIIKRSC